MSYYRRDSRWLAFFVAFIIMLVLLTARKGHSQTINSNEIRMQPKNVTTPLGTTVKFYVDPVTNRVACKNSANGSCMNQGTVTSIGLSVPGVIFSVSGSPITGSGNLTFTLLNQSANTFFAGPSSGAAITPTFRAIVPGDIPVLNQSTTGSAASLSAVLGCAQHPALTGDVTATAGGCVTVLPNIVTAGTFPKITFNAKGQVTAGGALASGDIPNNAANTTGNAATATAFDHTPTLCAAGNYPLGILASGAATGCSAAGGGSGTVTSVGLALPGEFTVTGTPVTGSGTLTGAWATQTQNKVFASPNGSTGAPTFRALVGADLPLPAASTLGGTKSITCGATLFLSGIDTSGNPVCTQVYPHILSLQNTSTILDAGTISTTETAYSLNYTFGANYFTVGKTVRVYAAFEWVTPGTAAATTLKAKLGSVAGYTSLTTTSGATSSTQTSGIWIYMTCISTGTSGTIRFGNGAGYGGSSTSFTGNGSGASLATVNTTISNLFTFSITYGAATAGNTTRLTILSIEELN